MGGSSRSSRGGGRAVGRGCGGWYNCDKCPNGQAGGFPPGTPMNTHRQRLEAVMKYGTGAVGAAGYTCIEE